MSYQTYAKIRDAHGLRDADVIKATGITKSTFSEWKKGTLEAKRTGRHTRAYSTPNAALLPYLYSSATAHRRA